MEVSAMQSSGLRCLQSQDASTSGVSWAYHRNGVAGDRSFSSVRLVSMWKRVSDFGQQHRSVRRASSGGSRRDQQKIVAKTQKRRSRHVKGITPTKDQLLDQLTEEEEADEHLEQSVRDIEENEADVEENEGTHSVEISDSADAAEDDTLVLQEKPIPPPEHGEQQDSSDPQPTKDLEKSSRSIENVDTDSNGSQDISCSEDLKVENEKWDQVAGKSGETTSSGQEEIIENDDNTFTIRFTPEAEQGVAQEQVNGAASNVQEGIKEAGSVAEQVSDIVQDTAKDVSKDVSNTTESTVEETGKNLQEARDVVIGNVEEGLDQAGSLVEEVSDLAQDTAQDVAATVQKTAKDSGESLSEAGDVIRQGVSDVGSQQVSIAREGTDALGEQLQEGQKEAEEAGAQAGRAVEKIAAEAGKSAEKVGDSLTTQFEDAAGTAEVIGGEALRLAEVVVDAVGKAAGVTQETGPKQSSRVNADESVQEESRAEVDEAKLESKSLDDLKEEPSQATKSEDEGLYVGLKVAVAGATGRTGRLIVEELVSRGVPVRAMVRDLAKARDLGGMSNVEIVKADLYDYEAVKRALRDSNVVICAIGASGLPFDPIGTYQTEYEGVKNLVAAAKNGGKIKKFVFITTVGVSFLQIVPLIFWKKQAELYLQRSGLDYTIVRPGGLKNEVDKGEAVLMKAADTQFGGSITRKKVAELCVDAVVTSEASEKVVEVVSGGRRGQTPAQLFGNV